MEEKLKRVELSQFVSAESNVCRQSPRGRFSGRRDARGSAKRPRRRRKPAHPVDATSMLVKCGICAAACALVLLLKWIGTPATENALETVKEAVNEEQELDEMLGKLQFVELPGILEVFSGSGKLMPPIAAGANELLREDTILALKSEQAQNVNASLAGNVKETGTDAELGAYVRIAGADDMELYLYGLSAISVEAGQPVLANDYVGSVEPGATLYIGLTVHGKPEKPAGYFMLETGRV